MSWLGDLAKAGLGLVPSLFGAAARMVGLKPVEPVPVIVAKHFFPPANTVQQWQVGENRCYYCLRYDAAREEVTQPPCTRHRPGNVELA